MKVLALSFGNSRISAVQLEGSRVSGRCGAAVNSRHEWPALVQWLEAQSFKAGVAAVSVNPDAERTFCNQLPILVSMAGRDFQIPIRNRTRTPETTGHDRLLTGVAAAKLYKPPLIVVDFGTAFTFNLIDEQGAFVGGAIAPGLGMAEASLPERCAMLSGVMRPSGRVPVIGTDTEAAMQSGLYNGYLGLVEHMIKAMRKESGTDGPVIATGGDAPYFVSASPSLFHDYDPDLLLKGVGFAYTEFLEKRHNREA
ncbi:MAG: type III pantothenate kinase [Planctomycetota bacterium]